MTPKNGWKSESATTATKRRIGIAGAGALGGVALLMLFAPMAAAGPVLFSAPFQAVRAVQVNVPVASGAGAQVQLTFPATFDAQTGQIRDGALVMASALGTSPVRASYLGVAGMNGLTFSANYAGPHFVRIVWTLGYQASMAAHVATPSPVPLVVSQLVVKVTANLVEKSTGQVVFGSQIKMTLLDKTITTGSFSATGIVQQLVLVTPFPVILKSGGVYAISTAVSLSLVAMTTGAGTIGDSASAQFAWAPASGITLVQVL